MEINNLEMISFRNHRKTNIDFDPGLTIIWGENGSGKLYIAYLMEKVLEQIIRGI